MTAASDVDPARAKSVGVGETSRQKVSTQNSESSVRLWVDVECFPVASFENIRLLGFVWLVRTSFLVLVSLPCPSLD